MSQRSHCQRCNITIRTIAVTALCSFSLSQRCARFRCHNAVLVFAVTALCTSVSDRCRIPPVYLLCLDVDEGYPCYRVFSYSTFQLYVSVVLFSLWFIKSFGIFQTGKIVKIKCREILPSKNRKIN